MPTQDCLARPSLYPQMQPGLFSSSQGMTRPMSLTTMVLTSSSSRGPLDSTTESSTWVPLGRILPDG